YNATRMGDGEAEVAKAFWDARSNYATMRNKVLDMLENGQVEQARNTRQHELVDAFAAQQKPLDALLDIQSREAEKGRSQSLEDYARAKWVSIITIVAGLGIAAVLSMLLVRSILNVLNQAVSVSEQIANGSLNNNIVIESNDEFGRLLTALKNMDGMLTKIVAEVRTSASTVGNAARELATGNDDLSQRTQEQASALEETASSMEQMTATVKQNSDNARQANQLAASARVQADQGGQVVSNAVDAMSEISEASNKIADIIRVIDEIAFQTNLLALNAAVEAARAGEQGRGFAVVATEVRSLAQRSATAAKEIKELIGNSVEKVAAGAALVNESGQTLQEIMTSVKKVADIVAEISAASEEQAAGIDQVNTAVTQMDSVTQQNAALVEQASAASKSMEMRAESLVQQISFFRVAGESAQPVIPATTVSATKKTVATATASAKLKTIPRKNIPARPVLAESAKRVANSGRDSVWTEF
ncbi:MAG: methyl-accepting chemotaxis protein, partial [Steroidobacter sp.]